MWEALHQLLNIKLRVHFKKSLTLILLFYFRFLLIKRSENPLLSDKKIVFCIT